MLVLFVGNRKIKTLLMKTWRDKETLDVKQVKAQLF